MWRAGEGLHLIAHRGGAACGPENSIAAIAEAKERGATDVEIDLHQTSDGRLVVGHDAIIDGSFISTLDFDQYSVALEARNETPTALEEVISVVRELELGLYLDVKQIMSEGLENLASAIESSNLMGSTVFSSFRSDLALQAKRRFGFVTSVLFYDPDMDLHSLVVGTGCDFVHPCFDVFPDPMREFSEVWVRRAQRTGAGIITWNTNSVEVANRVMGLSVDGICSDDPSVLLQALEM